NQTVRDVVGEDVGEAARASLNLPPSTRLQEPSQPPEEPRAVCLQAPKQVDRLLRFLNFFLASPLRGRGEEINSAPPQSAGPPSPPAQWAVPCWRCSAA